MNPQITNVRLIGRLAFRTVLRNKVMYLIVFLALLVLLPFVVSLAFFRMAAEACETVTVETMRLTMIQSLFALWWFAAAMLGITLGASAISSEIRSQTIVTLLSKPVNRWVFVAGKWSGSAVFLLVFLAVGFSIGLMVMRVFGLSTSGLFWLGLVHLALNVLLLSGLALSLSTLTPPVIAGAGAFLIQILSGWAAALVGSSEPYLRYPALAIYYLCPSQTDLLSDAFDKTVLRPEYGYHLQVLMENAGYLALVLLLGCTLFERREIRLK